MSGAKQRVTMLRRKRKTRGERMQTIKGIPAERRRKNAGSGQRRRLVTHALWVCVNHMSSSGTPAAGAQQGR